VTTAEGSERSFSETERDGRTSSGELRDDDAILSRITGSPPQGEEDTMYVSRMLVDALNRAGEHWLPPLQMTVGVADAIAYDAEDSRKIISIQVVRVETGQDLWQELRKTRDVMFIRAVGDMADTLRRAITHKLDGLRSAVSRRDVTLALDASRLPAYTFDDVVSAFDRCHGEWATSLGFDSIWVVGPHPQLVKCLSSAGLDRGEPPTPRRTSDDE
jgi:hypothetical protein